MSDIDGPVEDPWDPETNLRFAKYAIRDAQVLLAKAAELLDERDCVAGVAYYERAFTRLDEASDCFHIIAMSEVDALILEQRGDVSAS